MPREARYRVHKIHTPTPQPENPLRWIAVARSGTTSSAGVPTLARSSIGPSRSRLPIRGLFRSQ
ncbi:hypothetical protein BC834DRAFT_910730 [Gloeopeniophorella convolvens]|nr:hypothetical protein BC834DRAFT_910730 [Gloeopeniophorella convolvens]